MQFILITSLVTCALGTQLRQRSDSLSPTSSFAQSLFDSFRQELERSLLSQIFDETTAERIASEMDSCAPSLNSQFTEIATELLRTCVTGLPTSQLYDSVVQAVIGLYRDCPNLSTDLIASINIPLRSLLPVAMSVSTLLSNTDTGDFGQQEDLNDLVSIAIRVAIGLSGNGSVSYQLAEQFMDDLGVAGTDLLEDYILAIDRGRKALRTFTESTCRSILRGQTT